MTNFAERTLLFTIGLPLLLFIIIYFDRYAHIGWTVLIILVTILGSMESLHLFVREAKPHEKLLMPALGALLPVSAALDYLFEPKAHLFPLSLVFGISVILLVRLIVWRKEEIMEFTGHTAALIGACVYPALFMTYLVRFAEFSAALHVMLLFLVVSFANDTCAYLAGRMFGKRSKRIFEVSPKKTAVGFIGGFAGALLFGSIYAWFFPGIFAAPWSARLPFFLITAVLADAGDLIESAFKRAADRKDSGRLIPGRGGMLDSVDSLLFSAPFFYYSGIIIFV